MRGFFDKNRQAAGVILILFILSVLMIVLIHINPGIERWIPATNPFMVLEPESVEEKVIDGYAGVQRTYTLPIPDHIVSGAHIRFYLRHTYANFYLENASPADIPVEHDTPHIGHTPGHYWMSVPIQPSLAGEKMHIVLTPVYTTVVAEDPEFYLIDRDTLLTNIVLPKDRFMLVLSIITSASGMFLILFSLAPGLSGDNRRNLFYMGAPTVCAGIWKLCSLPAFLLFIDYTGLEKEVWYIGVLSYLLMLVLSLRLQISLRTTQANRITHLCFYIAAFMAILLVVLQLTNLVEIRDTLVWYGISVAFLHLISLFGTKPTTHEILWLFPFFITLGLDFIICIIKGSLRGAPFFLIWMLLNLFIRGFGLIQDDIEQKRQLLLKESELKDSRIRAMMSEIRPHFIHNTLASIYMLCAEDPEKAQTVVGDFAGYLQANFQAISTTELISFSRELEHTRAYLAVESVLYEGKLDIEYDIAETAFMLPPLTLQPIVENAIKHTVGSGRPRAHICIHTGVAEGCNTITVEDDGAGYNPLTSSTEDDGDVHIGLNNVRNRLEMMCGGSLEISLRDGGGTSVRILIPSAGGVNGDGSL